MMRYTYTIFNDKGVRQDVMVGHAPLVLPPGGYVEVWDNVNNRVSCVLRSLEELEEWVSKLERDFAWKPKIQEDPLTVEIDKVLNWTTTKYNPCKEVVDKIEQANKEYKDHINPGHYKDIIPGMQFAEMMQYMLKHCQDPFEGAMLYCVFKYLIRNGKKDDTLQEYKKAKWYLDYTICYLATGRKYVAVENVRQILKKEGCE